MKPKFFFMAAIFLDLLVKIESTNLNLVKEISLNRDEECEK